MRVRTAVLTTFTGVAFLFAMEQSAWAAGKSSPQLGAEAGKEIVVEVRKGLGKKVKGEFVRSGAEGITVLIKEGHEHTVPWESIRKVKAKRSRHSLWMGLAVGAATAGVALAADSGGDAGAAWGAAWVTAGAATGCLAAESIAPAEPPIYKPPKSEDPQPGPERK